MKNIYKTLAVMAICALGASFIVSCDDDKDEIVSSNDLPMQAQLFLQTYFDEVDFTVRYDKSNRDKEYEVNLSNGYEVTFNKDGEWTEVDAPYSMTVPYQIVPQPIYDYVVNNYTPAGINEIEKTRSRYNVELTNGVDLYFNLSGEFVGADK